MMPDQKPHVFISYVRENIDAVNRLCRLLTDQGIQVWLDRKDIEPGTRWKSAIRKAIQAGGFFIACFSKEYMAREMTYMNEELSLAIEELRQRHTDRAWFIPVKLNKCDIPDREISSWETLQDLQHVDLYEQPDIGIRQILQVILQKPFAQDGRAYDSETQAGPGGLSEMEYQGEKVKSKKFDLINDDQGAEPAVPASDTARTTIRINELETGEFTAVNRRRR